MSFLVLVVDDESDVEDLFRQQFRRDLRAGRFTMDFAQSGDGALQRIRDAAGASLILILSDINMPGMSGLELLPKAKATRPDVPVIMITAYGDADTERKALEGGADALLTKPIAEKGPGKTAKGIALMKFVSTPNRAGPPPAYNATLPNARPMV